MRKAIVDGQLVNLMDDVDIPWDAIRRGRMPIVCVGCGGKAHTRERTFDGVATLRLFAHNPGFADKCRLFNDVAESDEHELLKEAIVRTARASGWTADIEVVSPDERVRADVVCRRDGRTHSWEAQLASLNRGTAIDRHERYVHSFGRTTWVHTRRRDWSTDIPCVRVDDETQQTVVGGIFVDERAEEQVPPTPLASYVPRILDADGIQYLLEPFGFYRDLGAISTQRRRSGRSRRMLREGIYYSTTDCPSDTADDDLDELSLAASEPATEDGWAARHQRSPDEEPAVSTASLTGAARMAAAREAAGLPLNERDRQALAAARRQN